MRVNSFIKRVVGAAAIVTLMSHAPVQAQSLPGTQLEAQGTEIFVTFLHSDAGYSSDVEFFVAVGGTAQFLFNNKTATSTPIQVSVTPGQEVIFGIFVTKKSTGQTWQYYVGDGTRNPDGLVHAQVLKTGPGTYQIGFEDMYGGGDLDYNDVVFQVSGAVVNPEPVTMVLLGSGLFGLGGAGLARRRRKHDDL